MLKKVIILVVSIIGVIALLVGSFMGWFSYQLRVLEHLETSKISDSLYVIKGDMSNMYLLKIDSTIVAFDASDNVECIESACNKFGIDPKTVKAVFLSHSDADHVNGLPAFPNADVYLNRTEEILLQEKGHRHFLGMSMMNKLPVSDYKILNDQDSVIIDNITIHAIATPGHTIGSMCYMYNESIFTGDLCIVDNGEVKPMINMFTEDRERDSLSILQISKMNNISEMYTAHSGYHKNLGDIFESWN